MLKNIVLTLILVLIILSCNRNYQNFRTDYFTKINVDSLLWDEEDFDSLVTLGNYYRILHPEVVEVFGCSGFFVADSLPQNEFNKLISLIKSKASSIIPVIDSNALYVNTKVECPSSGMKTQSNPPLPNISYTHSPLARIGFNPGASYFAILSSKNGYFFKDLDIPKSCGLPSAWSRGYSAGALIDSANYKVVYWQMVW